MTIQTAKVQTELLQRAVLLTGAPRSGTTLLGKLLSTLKGLEYHFEPSSLYMIASAYSQGELPLGLAARLLSVYLCEDLLLESIHGRGVNLRPTDDSQVLNRMSWSELNQRWHEISDRSSAITCAREEKLRLAVKMPNLYDSLPLMAEVMPQGYLLVSVRNGVNVVRSIIRKGWLSNDGLKLDLWPYCGSEKGVNIPYWVEPQYRERWSTMSEESRACLMWSCHAEKGYQVLGDGTGFSVVHQVRYEELLKAPWPVVEEMAEVLGGGMTIHTRRWVDTIHTPRSMQQGDSCDFMSATDSDILQRFERVNALWGY